MDFNAILFTAVAAIKVAGSSGYDYSYSKKRFDDVWECDTYARAMLHREFLTAKVGTVETAHSFCAEQGPIGDRRIEIKPKKE